MVLRQMREKVIPMKSRAKSNNRNKGFSLVEVIIAVIILGIAFSPLLSNLIQSARINGKSRRTMDATNMAQNLMEGLNAYSADEIIKGFDTLKAGQNLAILPSGMACSEYGEASDGTTLNYNVQVGSNSVNGTPKYCVVSANSVSGNTATKVLKSDDNKYIFYMKNVDGATYTDYDIRLTMDTNPYHKANAGDPDKYNDIEVANIASTNKFFDAIWQDKVNDYEEVAAQIYANTSGANGKTQKEIIANTKRKLEIVIDDTGTATAPNYVVTGIDKYYFNAYNPYYYSESDLAYNKSTILYNMTNTGQSPRNIYVYYWPNYKSDLSGVEPRRDDFIVTNKTDLPVKVYFVRMSVDDTAVTTATSDSTEANYYINIRVTDHNNSISSINNADTATQQKVEEFVETNTSVFTNMRENIMHTHKENVEKNASGAYINTYYKENRVKVFFRTPDGSTGGYTDGMQVTDQARCKVLVGDLADEKDKERIYTLKLEVYEKGSADAGFPEEGRVATFTGGALQ